MFLGPVGDRALALLHYEILQLGAQDAGERAALLEGAVH